MSRIQSQRTHNRDHFVEEVVPRPVLKRIVPLVPSQETDVLRCEGREQIVIEDAVLLCERRAHLLMENLEGLFGVLSVCSWSLAAETELFLKA